MLRRDRARWHTVRPDDHHELVRTGIADQQLAELVVHLRDEDRLCVIHAEGEDAREPRIICSLGLRGG